MKTVVGVHVHQAIVDLIRRAQVAAFLVTPFVRPWPELTRAVADAIARGVHVRLVVKQGWDEPDDDELALFARLDIDVLAVPRLHLKLYLSEREALIGSANLTQQSVGSALEAAMLVEREKEPDAWYDLHEVWFRVHDEADRSVRPPAVTATEMMSDSPFAGLRARADSGDPRARAAHRYCIVCGVTADSEGNDVVCRKCDAAALARDEAMVWGTRCTRCNTAYRSNEERPYCDSCYRDTVREERAASTWIVSGRRGGLQMWWIPEQPDLKHLSDPEKPRRSAVSRRHYLLGTDPWLRVTVHTRRTEPLDIWALAHETIAAPSDLHGLTVERHSEVPPRCDEPMSGPPEQMVFLACSRSTDAHKVTRWERRQQLAEWAIEMMPGTGRALLHPTAPWLVMVSPRKQFTPDVMLDPDKKVALELDIELGVPDGLDSKWIKVADLVVERMLAALHQHHADDLAVVFKGQTGKVVDRIREVLMTTAPLGPTRMGRHPNGQIKDSGGRPDRVAALVLRRTSAAGANWSLKATVHTVALVPVH